MGGQTWGWLLMLELGLFTKPLIGAIFTLVLQRNPQHQKVLLLKLLKYCNGVTDRYFLGLYLSCTCKLLEKLERKGWVRVWFTATEFPTPATGASALFHCTFFSEKHIQLLTFKVLWLKKMIRSPPSTLPLPPCESHNSRGWRQEGCLCSLWPGELLGDLVNGMSKVAHVARGDPCHRDTAILCHVDGELLGQPLHLQREECVGTSWSGGSPQPWHGTISQQLEQENNRRSVFSLKPYSQNLMC